MKKYILVLVLLVFPFFARAAVPDGTYFFMDNKGYDESGTQKYFCLMDSNCYTVAGDFAFKKEVAGATTVKSVSVIATDESVPAVSGYGFWINNGIGYHLEPFSFRTYDYSEVQKIAANKDIPGFYIVTDRPTTASFIVYSSDLVKSPIKEDNHLDTVHFISYQDLGMEKNRIYTIDVSYQTAIYTKGQTDFVETGLFWR